MEVNYISVGEHITSTLAQVFEVKPLYNIKEHKIPENKRFVSINEIYSHFRIANLADINNIIDRIKKYALENNIQLEEAITKSFIETILLSAIIPIDITKENIGIMFDKDTHIGELRAIKVADFLDTEDELLNKLQIYSSTCSFISAGIPVSHYEGVIELSILGYNEYIEAFNNRLKQEDIEFILLHDKVLSSYKLVQDIALTASLIKNRADNIIEPVIQNNYSNTVEFWEYATDVLIMYKMGYLSAETIKERKFNVLINIERNNPYVFELYLTNIDNYKGTKDFRRTKVEQISRNFLKEHSCPLNELI